MKKKTTNKKKASTEFWVIADGKFKGDFINVEGRRYKEHELRARRPDLFT